MAFSLQDLFPHLMTDPAGSAPDMPAPQAPSERQGPSKGQMILGILGDALAGAAGRGPVYGQMIAGQRQRADEQAQEEANWGRRLQNYEAQKQIDQRYDKPDMSPMMRDVRDWGLLGAEGQAAYRAMQAAKPQFIPDGMGGGQWATPPGPQASPRAGPPQGITFTPIPGGAASPSPRGFRR